MHKIYLYLITFLTITFTACSSTIPIPNNQEYTSFLKEIKPVINTKYDINVTYLYTSDKEIIDLFNEYQKSLLNLDDFLKNKPLLSYNKNPYFINDSIRINHKKNPEIVYATKKDIPLILDLEKEYNRLPKNYNIVTDEFLIDINEVKNGVDIFLLNKTKNTYILKDIVFTYGSHIYSYKGDSNLIPGKIKNIFLSINDKYIKNNSVNIKLKIKHKIYNNDIIIYKEVKK